MTKRNNVFSKYIGVFTKQWELMDIEPKDNFCMTSQYWALKSLLGFCVET
jgi:hypothetical protein